MSLVQAYIYKNFILVGGDQLAILSNGQVIDNFVKVRKINNNVIIGMSGTIEGNATLFSYFVNNDLTIKEKNLALTYEDIIRITHKSYFENNDFLQKHSVHSVVCGWDGYKFTGYSYFTKDNDKSMNRPIDLTPDSDSQVKIINCGMHEHYMEAIRLLEENNPSNINIRQFKNLFRDVIDKGVKFDKTINHNITFEAIRKVDVL